MPLNKVSVVICTRNRADMIEMAIKSVLGCSYGNFDVHIMDQSTDDLTKDIVQRYQQNDSRLIYHHLPKPGLSRSYNIGKDVTDGHYIACTDDDVIVPENWISSIANRFDSDPEIGLIYGQVCIPEALASIVKPGVIVPALMWEKFELHHRRKGNYRTFGMGANSAVRRSAWDASGGYDEVMGVGAPLRGSQDSDFAYRIYHAGFSICLDPEIKVDHYGTRLPEQWPDTLLNYGFGDGAYYGKYARLGHAWALRALAHKAFRFGMLNVAMWIGLKKTHSNIPYFKNIITGWKKSTEYEVDANTLLYIPKDADKDIVNAANSVTRIVVNS
jgi:glycosyltransferase involved in cell wall biosynthesis